MATEKNELIVQEQIDPKALLVEGKGVDDLLKAIRTKAFSFGQGILTENERDTVRSIAHDVARSKTFLVSKADAIKKPHQEVITPVNKNIKKIKDNLDALKAEYRKPLTDYEDAEEKRIAKEKAEEDAAFQKKIDERMEALVKYGRSMPYQEVSIMSDEDWDETIAGIRTEWEAEQTKIKEEEANRKAKQAKLDRQAKKQAAEKKRLADEQKKIDADKKAIEDQKEKVRSQALKNIGIDITGKGHLVFTDPSMDGYSEAPMPDWDVLMDMPEEEFLETTGRLTAEVEIIRTKKSEATKAAELAEKKRLEKIEKDRADEKRWRERLELLYEAGWNGQEAFDSETDELIISYEDLVNISDTDFHEIADNHNKKIKDRNTERQYALLSDKTKAIDWVEAVRTGLPVVATVEDRDTRHIMVNGLSKIKTVLDEIHRYIEEL